jgi:hypothetical protein
MIVIIHGNIEQIQKIEFIFKIVQTKLNKILSKACPEINNIKS